MKHIVFVIGYYKNGGVAMRATNLANELVKRGYRVTILVTKEIGDEIYFQVDENVEIVSLQQFIDTHRNDERVRKDILTQQKKLKTLKRMRYVTRFFKTIDKKLEKRIRGIRVSENIRKFVILNKEAIFIPFGMSYFEMVAYATADMDSKVIYAERNAPQFEIPDDTEKANNLLELLRKANGIIVQTEEEKKFYKSCESRNIAVIHNPIKKNLPKRFIGNRKEVITNFCRIAEQKNLKLLVDAFIKLSEDYLTYELHIYGNAVEVEEEKLREELIKYISSLNMDHKIYVFPPTAEVHSKIRDCAMFVSSSDFEGLSNSMIEAMAIGMPCVCTDCIGGGAREMISHKKNGLLVPIKDVDALYKAMKFYIENPYIAEQCGKNAVNIINDMSVEKIVDKWMQVIEKV